jgi:phosphatidylglycerol---prolipoprotein diacylglyceryl transferase
MTLYPLVFHLFGLEITGYGIMLMIAFLMAGWVMDRELRRRAMNRDFASDVVVAALIGGIVGAKLWYVLLTGDPATILSRGGFVWYGGLAGGAAGVILVGWLKRVPIRFTMDLAAPALALGYAIGRVGCFVVEDDYGIPTHLPWAVKFPQGLPPTTAANLARFNVTIPPGTPPTQVLAVHPTELYEVAAMLFVFWILWRLRRNRYATGWLFGVYMILAGLERFLVEFVRAKDDRVLHGFTLAQLASVIVMLVGVALVRIWWRDDGFSAKGVESLAPRAPV